MLLQTSIDLIKELHSIVPECLPRGPNLASIDNCLQNLFKDAHDKIERHESEVNRAYCETGSEEEVSNDFVNTEVKPILERYQEEMKKLISKVGKNCVKKL